MATTSDQITPDMSRRISTTKVWAPQRDLYIPGSSTPVSSTAVSSTPISSTDVSSTQFFSALIFVHPLCIAR